ncbi:MAG TPA: NF038122 family metalloprotease [Blastocatellia bacterium]|nr:NF038122 family metalloprotease [Blastocatellia bacterium]
MKRLNFSYRLRVLLAAVLVWAAAVCLFSSQRDSVSFADAAEQSGRARLRAVPGASQFTLYARDGDVGCRAATEAEARMFSERDPSERLYEISPISLADANAEGLNIVLRGTQQLEGFPQAKEAFLRSAAIWQSRIKTDITVVVDVDFGPRRFGTPYPQGVLGSTGSQELGAPGIYPEVRAALIAGAASPQEAGIYNSLPVGAIPTDKGSITHMIAPSAVFRALGLIDPVADPAAEEEDFGDPPSIGFNSNFSFDFDPSDGIQPGRVDFEAVAVHEIGHALGFVSMVGLQEFNSRNPLAASVWDLFRFRPGTTPATFSTAARILTPGGVQSEFAAGLQVPQSTGGINGNGSGGDGEQSSHWKDDRFTGRYIGIMDPRIASGERNTITSHDLAALDLFGYTLTDSINVAPEVGDFSAAVDTGSRILTLRGGATDSDSDIVFAELELLDGSGGVIGELSTPVNNPLGSPILGLNIQIASIAQISALRQMRITLRDDRGNLSQKATTIVLLDNDPNRPTINNITYNGKKMVIKGIGFNGDRRLEINGVIVAPPINVGGGAKKMKIKGKPADLNLFSGQNSVRAISDNRRSDVFSFSF